MASGDLRPKLSILLSQWIIILVIKYAWYQFWEIGQFWIIKIHTWLRGWRILCSRQDTLTFQTRSLAWENFWKRSCDAVGRMGSRCLSRALGGKAVRMAPSLTCARTIPPATQAEEKKSHWDSWKKNAFLSFYFPSQFGREFWQFQTDLCRLTFIGSVSRIVTPCFPWGAHQ